MSRVLVIGGGIIARAAAFRLQHAGHDVTLLAMPDKQPASWGNAGHIATEQITPLARFSTLRRALTERFPNGPVALDWRHAPLLLPWALRFLQACRPAQARRGETALRALMADALPAWERLVADLGAPSLLDRRGIVKLWEGKRAVSAIRAEQHADHGTAQAIPVTDAVLAQLQTRLDIPLGGGLHYPGTAHVTDPGTVLETLLAGFLSAGGRHLEGQATAIEHSPGRIAVLGSAGRLEADHVVLACGVRSGGLMPDIVAPLIAERGYHVQWAHGGEWALPNVVFENRAIVITRFGASLRATSFVEFTHPDSPPDPRKWAWLEQEVRKLGLPVASPFTRWVGSRPTLPDYLPALGATKASPRVHAAYGHNHLGLTLAAITAETLVASVQGHAPAPVFSPDRFGRSRIFRQRKNRS